MIGLGTIINTASIIGAGIVGHFAGNLFNSEQQESVGRACGISVLFIAIAGTMEGMLKLDSGSITAVNTTPVIMNPNQSFFFIPRKSAIAPRYGASTATSRLAKDTA